MKQQGWTIVETLIVLAIAGLVFSIVFIAVPRLQGKHSGQSRFENGYREDCEAAGGNYIHISYNHGDECRF